MILNRPRIVPALLACSLALASTPNLAIAGETNACGTVLCLAGALMGKMPGSCKKYTNAYFSILKFSWGSFSPTSTAKARMKLLNQCSSSDSGTRNSINNTFGRLFIGI